MNAIGGRVLNQGQQDAADGFFTFLFNEEKEIILSGGGGYGKTYLMGYLIDIIMPRYFETCQMMGIEPEYDSVEMTATTNQAAVQLALATGRPTRTIYNFLSLTVKNDRLTGEASLIRKRDWAVHTRKIVFIDECSMEDQQLIEELHDATLGCKIVHVGDHCQLGPIKRHISPLYNRGLGFFNLTEPMRNAGQPDLVKVCQQLRNTVETGIFEPIQIKPGVIDWVDDEDMQLLIAQTFQKQTRDSRILAYTNERVQEFNEHIRQLRGLPTEYSVGELLINNSAIHLNKTMIAVEEEIEILELSEDTEQVTVDFFENRPIHLEVRRVSFKTRLGSVYRDVRIPVDRDHFGELLRHYSKRKNWSKLFDLKETYPDFRMRDAATAHKAQGSTYETVFIDVGNLSTCHQPQVVSRLLYVVFSRARSRVILYGDLAQKYGGLIH